MTNFFLVAIILLLSGLSQADYDFRFKGIKFEKLFLLNRQKNKKLNNYIVNNLTFSARFEDSKNYRLDFTYNKYRYYYPYLQINNLNVNTVISKAYQEEASLLYSHYFSLNSENSIRPFLGGSYIFKNSDKIILEDTKNMEKITLGTAYYFSQPEFLFKAKTKIRLNRSRELYDKQIICSLLYNINSFSIGGEFEAGKDYYNGNYVVPSLVMINKINKNNIFKISAGKYNSSALKGNFILTSFILHY